MSESNDGDDNITPITKAMDPAQMGEEIRWEIPTLNSQESAAFVEAVHGPDEARPSPKDWGEHWAYVDQKVKETVAKLPVVHLPEPPMILTFRAIHITPEVARHWLTMSWFPKPMVRNKAQLKRFVAHMKAGEWTPYARNGPWTPFTGNTIKFVGSGTADDPWKLVDGWMRLTACVQADTAIDAVVHLGFPKDRILEIDT